MQLTTFTYPLVVKALQLLSEGEVFEESRTSVTGLQADLVVDWSSPVGSQVRGGVVELELGEILLSTLCGFVDGSGSDITLRQLVSHEWTVTCNGRSQEDRNEDKGTHDGWELRVKLLVWRK